MSTEANKALIRRLFAALRHEEERAEALTSFSSDVELGELFSELAARAPGCYLKIQDLLADTDKVLVLFELLGTEARAEPCSGALLCRIENGRIVEHQLEPDMTNLP